MRLRTFFWLASFIFALLTYSAPLSAQQAPSEESVSHTVVRGDTLFRIALRYGVTVDELARANNIVDVTRIYSGQVLIIPGLAPVSTGTEVSNPLIAPDPIEHIVQRGESLTIIANRYGITVEQLLQMNPMSNPNRIFAGNKLQIWTPDMAVSNPNADPSLVAQPTPQTVTIIPTAVPDIFYTTPAVDPNAPAPVVEQPVVVEEAAPAVAANEVLHTVRAGEYLSQIARTYGVTWTSIAEYNGISDPNKIYAGLTLRIPNANASVAQDMSGIITSNLPVVGEPGPRVGVGREIVVVLSTQMTYAYEDGVLQRAALVSTGLPATPTVQGDYKIYLKYESQNMSGPGYYLPGVPWVMYFYQGYGIHGTYWHSNFGTPMSRGCVNMENSDAEWFWRFAPMGTPVHVRWS